VLYLFAMEGGVLTARPCAAKAATLSAPPSALAWYAGYPIAKTGLSAEAGSLSPGFAIPTNAVALFFYVLTQGVWMPAGGDWVTALDAGPRLISLLSRFSDNPPIGAYVWNGQTMTWLQTPTR
jgi:hypothetical protein